ncbi:MAG TPA: S8 family serine peptidase [Gaiellaceae bacterium]|nr:S8 family serine peptidase [Gaiellaceae bacterium]
MQVLRSSAGSRRRWFAVACLAAITSLGLVAAGTAAGGGSPSKLSVVQTLTAQSSYQAAKSDSGQIARTDPSLLNRTGSQLVPVMIKYDLDATASYAGGIQGLSATSPRVTGKSLKQNHAAVAAYTAYANGKIQSLNAAVRSTVPSARIRQWYETAYGGVAAQVPANKIGALLSVPGVVAVQKDALEQPLDDNTAFIGATNVWPHLGGTDTAGSNVVFGDIDTGVWPESPLLVAKGSEPAPPKPLSAYTCDFGDGSDTGHLGPTFTCNNKLIGAHVDLQTYMAVDGSDGQEFCNDITGRCSARDSEGHGTHTTTTAAGDCVSSAVLYGVQRGPVCGIAPGAHVIEYRVCLSKGCFNSDSVQAIQQAIADGVNVINFSIGGGGNPYTDAVEMAFLDATNAGISVNASAGNDGPGAGTAEHGGPWVTTVGASTGPRSFTSTLHLTADGGATLDVPGVTLTNGISTPTPVVLAATLAKAGGGSEDALCQSDLAAGAATGKVVVCERGVNGRIDKGRRVLAGGAAGMILYNNAANVTDLESDNHYLPAIQTQFDNDAIANFVSSHTNVMATWAQGASSAQQADVMASFSSRGPEGDWIKPDVTAPGIQVLAGTTPQPDQTTADNGPPGNLFMAIAGTSMSSPHAAGASILVKAEHPTWTPEEVKSALMTSSVQDVVKEDGTTPAGVFDDGAGSIRVDRAVNPTLVFNETTADFNAAATDKLDRVDLNLASVDDTTMSGDVTTHRTAINVSGKNKTLDVQVTQPAGVRITVNNGRPIHVARDATVTFPIEISAPAVADGQYQGRINLVPRKGGNTVTIPVAFVRTQGSVTLTSNCSPLSFPAFTNSAPSATHCSTSVQNVGSVTANATLNVSEGERGGALIYKNVGLPGSVIGTGQGVQWSGSLSPALAPPVQSLTAGGGEPYGYFPLSSIGVQPVPGFTDDSIQNFGVPTFFYGHEAYDQIGVVSNGYVVVGGGNSSDVIFTSQHFPNPARPNNVVSPFWTDLNPVPPTSGCGHGGGNIYVAGVGDGEQNWTVVDFEAVSNCDTADTHSFEVWIRIPGDTVPTGPSSEQITIAYGANGPGDPDGTPNWGAENRDGTSGVNLPSQPANGSQYSVDMGSPTPGGQVTIPYDITSKTAGSFTSVASMTSDQTKGTTQVVTPLTVTP